MAGTAMFAALALVVVNLAMHYSHALGGGHVATTHEERVSRLLEVMYGGNMGEAVRRRELEDFAATGRDEEFLTRFRETAEQEEAGLKEAMLQVYLKHYDEGTAGAALRFFNSPAGKNLLQERGAIAAESNDVIRAWIKQVEEKMSPDGQ